jgi:hypothetical protein
VLRSNRVPPWPAPDPAVGHPGPLQPRRVLPAVRLQREPRYSAPAEGDRPGCRSVRRSWRVTHSEPWAAQRLLPPHPGPLPWGEGATHPGRGLFQNVWLASDAEAVFPLPGGKGQGEGEGSVLHPTAECVPGRQRAQFPVTRTAILPLGKILLAAAERWSSICSLARRPGTRRRRR